MPLSVLAVDGAALEGVRANFRLPGLAGALIDDGNYSELVSGVRKVDRSEKIEKGDLFHLGSCGKSMSATMVAILVDQGKLTWETKLSEVLAGLEGTSLSGVTIEQLTSHTSGITGDLWFDGGSLWSDLWKVETSGEGRQLVVKSLSVASKKAPGLYEYGNYNYMLLAAVVDVILSQPWEQSIRELLLKPLQMDTCSFGPVPSSETSPQQPWPHARGADGVSVPKMIDNPATLSAAGTIHCSLQDWSKYLQLHLTKAAGRKSKVFNNVNFQKLYETPVGSEYTYGGWFRVERPWTEGFVFTHSGSNLHNFAVTWLDPSQNRAAMAVTNQAARDRSNQRQATDVVIQLLLGLN